uniref:cryptochrome/photolyase family protein n=1 Tax=Algoriphagus sp. TaxID=1872435 RepID=UPI0040482A72
MAHTLRLILGDQLNSQHSWFTKTNPDVTYLMLEMRQETDYVTHHIQKVLGFFLSMRQFAQELQEKGHQFIYLTLDDPQNQQSLATQIKTLVTKEGFNRFEYLLPDEYRLDQQLKECCNDLGIPCQAVDTEHFLSDREFLTNFFKGNMKETFFKQSLKHVKRSHLPI